jgi:hypothetical protein
MTAPEAHGSVQLQLGGLEELPDPPSARRDGSLRPRAQRGPKGARVGDVIIAEGSRWFVESVNPERHEATCRLIGGSRILRRFRARAIRKVERTPRRAELLKSAAAVMEPNPPEDNNS